MIVLDASVVVELLTNGNLADSMRNELAGRDESFLVPHLIDIEVISALRRLVAGQRIDSRVRLVAGESEAAEPRARRGLVEQRPMRPQGLKRGLGRIQLVELMLGKIADVQFARAGQFAALRLQPPGQQFGERRFAIAILAEEGKPVVGIDPQR